MCTTTNDQSKNWFVLYKSLSLNPLPPTPSSPLQKKENMKNQKWICNHPFLVDYNSSHKIGNKSAVCKTYIFHFCRAWRGLKNPRDMMLQLFCKMKKTRNKHIRNKKWLVKRSMFLIMSSCYKIKSMSNLYLSYQSNQHSWAKKNYPNQTSK